MHVPDERAQVVPAGNETVPVLGLTKEKVIKVPPTGAPPTTDALQVVDVPTMTVEGAQEAETVGDALLTVIEDVPELAKLVPSPG